MTPAKRKKAVLAYSGGLDTTVSIPWLKEKHGLDVVAMTIDVGGEKEIREVQQRALAAGAVKALVVDAREEFIKDFAFPALQADAIYEGQYLLATALSRPLIAKHLVQVARREGATTIAHGCTGKGNDQVRFDVSVAALAPDLKVIAPAREWSMSRQEAIEYAQKRGLPITASKKSLYSVDVNLWGRSIECGPLDDPWTEPPEEVYAWTAPVDKCPSKPTYVEVEFQEGLPVALDDEELSGVALTRHLNDIAGANGVGRVDHIENRLVGIKSREVYESPAATVLLKAHQALEQMALTKDQLRFKALVAQHYADLIYNGLWFSRLREDLAAYVQSTQRFVTGTVRVRLHKGSCVVVGRKSPYSLYQYELATYDKADAFDHTAAPGFIHIWGLPVRTQARVQRKRLKGRKP
jgi:argininosuccinate synthase